MIYDSPPRQPLKGYIPSVRSCYYMFGNLSQTCHLEQDNLAGRSAKLICPGRWMISMICKVRMLVRST